MDNLKKLRKIGANYNISLLYVWRFIHKLVVILYCRLGATDLMMSHLHTFGAII